MGLLDQFTQAVDARKRYYGNIVRGLLDNPQALLEQLRAQNTENVRDRSRAVQETKSVMPEVAEPAKRAAFDEALNAALMGITVYHGSPHKFDKFDASKIGTGEGAQAYGHGLYFAENPGVAKTYTAVNEPSYKNAGVRAIVSDAMKDAAKRGLSGNKARIWARNEISKLAQDRPSYARQQWYDAANNIDSILDDGVGNLYKVDIPDEAVAKMLDWDKPLSQQPEAVRKGVRELINRGKNEAANGPFAMDGIVTTSGRSTRYATTDVINELDGASILQMLKRVYGNQAESELRSLGIPGIRYLDAGSRGKGGTSNFVLFDDQLPKIIGRE